MKWKIGDKWNVIKETLGLVEKQPKFLVSSIWNWECYDKDGNLKWQEEMHNVCTAEGLNSLLNIMFHGANQITTWYVAIFETDTTPADGTTYAVPVYTECQAYDEATRPEYVEAEASAKVTTNTASKATFTMNASKTIYGGALVGGGEDPTVKGNTAGGGVLFCASKFSSSKSVVSADVLKVTIALTAADT
jgi:hypothetical protein